MPYIGNQPAPTNVTSTNITDGTITNADINANAAIALTKLDNVTATNTELNILDGATVTTAELNTLDGITSTVGELNILDGVTANASELNYLDITTTGTVEPTKAVTADANGDVKFPDGEKAVFGTGSDLQIYHDGTSSLISDQGNGPLLLRATDFQMTNSAGSQYIMQGVDGGAVTLYHAGSGKVATTATGADVTGEFKATSYNETYVSLTAAATVDVDCETGNYFALSTDQNTTFTFSNPPATGTGFVFILEITQGGAYTLTWPSSVAWAGGTAPDAPGSSEVAVYAFSTRDGGTTWYGFQAGTALA
jgi:hypothetical protein